MKDNKKDIDQLFKHFSDQEVPYNPESWDKMEALLDKELPVKSSYAKRLWPHIVGLGLIASLVIGYFITPFQEMIPESKSLDQTEAFKHVNQNNKIDPDHNSVEQWVQTTLKEDSDEFFEETELVLKNKFNSNNTHPNSVPKKADKKEAQLVKTIEGLKSNKEVIEKEIHNIDQQQQLIGQNNLEAFVIDEPLKVIKGPAPKVDKKSTTQLESIHIGSESFVKDINTNFIYQKNIDTLSVFRIAERSFGIKDTLSIILTQRNHFEPLPLVHQIEILEHLKQEKVKELAGIKANISSFENKLILSHRSNTLQSQHSNHFKQWFNNYFHENKPQYASLYLGGSSLLNQYLYSGAHLGVGIGYILSKNWNWSVDLKYTRQFLGKLSFDDVQSDFEIHKQYTGQNWEYEGVGKEDIQSYTLDNLQDFQLSTYFSYNTESGFSFLMGLVAKARLPIQYKSEMEINQFEINQVSSNGGLYENQSWQIDPKKDFKASFSLGYMVGLQYDLNKQWAVQAKMNHSVLHSVKSNFDYLKKMANAPTLELSLGYYFGRKDKIIYIMDYNK